ncbi:Acyl-protein thioesterase [Lachnellula willkommii]|uniref:Acyl-protein thioesterase n=1 Tax=Lachnellula willkommii TaxID=215461 RepID=A0A559MJM0_9HELO|nr:Acyl-protein thioesterase [Lachnellula willkommii]
MSNNHYPRPLSNQAHAHRNLLHGREDYGSVFAQYFFDSEASDAHKLADIFPTIRWLFPTARLRYSAQRDFEFSNSSFTEALKGEEIISQWFDVWDIARPEEREGLMVAGLRESVRVVVRVVREEAQSVPLEQIILGGISQGCAAAVFALMYSGMELGGFIGLCSWLPFQKEIETLLGGSSTNKDEISRHIKDILGVYPDMDAALLEQADAGEGTMTNTTEVLNLEANISTLSINSKAANKTPLFLSHSQDDETVPFALGEGLHQTTEQLGFDVTWKEYEDGGHWINPKHGVDDMSAFLHKALNI